MNIHLENIANALKGYSLSLSKSSILIDKPWSLIDEDGDLQRLIFKSNKELIISKNGQASIGKWEYLPQARSLLIDRGKDKILCNEFLVLNGILVLKKDGTKSDLFVLCNENVIPDLDPIKYLLKVRKNYMQIKTELLVDGRKLEFIYDKVASPFHLPYNVPVTIDFIKVDDGIYCTSKGNKKYIIKDGIVRNILWQKTYFTIINRKIIIDQHDHKNIKKGDLVWYNDQLIEDGTFKLSNKRKISTHNGKVVKISIIDKFRKSLLLLLALWLSFGIFLFTISLHRLNMELDYYLENGYTRSYALELIKENQHQSEKYLNPWNIGIVTVIGSVVILLINQQLLKRMNNP